MRLLLWLRFAARDLRSGLQGFWIFLACLALGTAAIAIIGSLSAAIERGLDEQGQSLLGGDVAFSLVHREATPAEHTFMTSKGTVSRTATMRAMAVAGDATTLVEAKAIDANYPLFGKLELSEGGDLQALLALRDGQYGAVVDPLLLGRLGIKLGHAIKIGNTAIAIRGTIATEPDRLSDGIIFGPRLMMNEQGLKATGLIQPGSLITWHHRIRLNPEIESFRTVIRQANKEFPDAGWRIRNRNNAASGADRFVERLGYFMTLVSLASLIVGGAGIANAVSAFVSRRTNTIATLKCLGARSRDVFGIYLTEILAVGLLAVSAALAVGAIVPRLAGGLLEGVIPLPVSTGVEMKPLAIAALLGLLVTLVFGLWPLSRTRRVPASAMFRHRIIPLRGVPTTPELTAIALALVAIAMVVFLNFDEPRITAYYLAGLAGSFIALLALARLIIWLASSLPAASSAIWRYAIGNIHRPGSAAASVILALGLGLTLFVTLALTDRTIGAELRSNIPEKAPAFFFLDVQNDQLANFVATLNKETGVTEITTAPMLRGRIIAVKGVAADKVKATGDGSWALHGDRGLTYADSLPRGSALIRGEWWPKDYSGPPLVSLVGEVADGIGATIGDELTINVLGRELTAKIANLRDVNWRSLGINFVMVFSPNTLKAAPHSHIVTVEMASGDEAKLLNDMARAYPSATAIRVKEAIATVSDLLNKMLTAIRSASLATLLTGVLVLAGALAAGLSERLYDAVVLKTYGASRRQLISAFVIEYAALGLAAAAFGVLVGSIASWFLARFILDMTWRFSLPVAILTALAAMVVTVLGGLLVTWSALSAKPAGYLRNE